MSRLSDQSDKPTVTAMPKQLEIRNSTAEFLIFQMEGQEKGKHIANIFAEGELREEVVVSKMEITTEHSAIEGKTQSHEVKFLLALSSRRCQSQLPTIDEIESSLKG